MVKERFEYYQDKTIGCYYIWDKYYGEHLMLFDVEEHIKKTCNLLNRLQEESTTLKSINREYEDALARLKEENRQLKSENGLLKQDLEHCANQFKDDGKNVLLGLK